MRRALKPVLILSVLLLSVTTGMSTAEARQGSRYRPPVVGTKGMVATESPAAGRVGRDVLEHGGNAVDAAVATVFALNVARPQGCGIGGGGFMVYRSAAGRSAALDFRESAPRRFTPKVFKKPGLHDDYTGHLTVGVPGALAGMRAALRRYGTRSLAQSIAPAERMAAHGVKVTPAVSASMRENAKRLRKFPTAARQFLRHGRAYRAGATLRQPALARTLRLIRRHGTGAFYRGVIARRIGAEMARTRRHPIKGDRALLTARDIAGYRAKWRKPLRGTFRGRELVAMPPPTSGGVLVLELLNIMERFDNVRSGMSSVDTLHRIIEAEKLALADRNAYVADPDFVHAPVATLISKGYAARRAALIDANRAGNPKPGLGPFKASGPENPKGNTTQVSVMDAAGNAVSLTCTIEQEFGSAVVAPGTGFLLNNEMTDFGDPGSANEPHAGKRPRSSMSPIIASENGRPIDVTGGAGGSRIMMGAFFSVFNRIEYGLDLDHAIDAERVDAVDFTQKKIVHVEQKRLAPGVVAGLRARGQKLDLVGEYDDLPRVQAVGYAAPGGPQRLAVSDSRTENGSYRQR